ncbi:alpha/beta hydrolase-fold protein [Asanoa sp. NPDC049573]|uniref:alpha/beta hydrolase-fold protein n=1 Tax=Asanoa sp. NPDC049573 TaxID=3155396 RepID=UPI00342B90DC
MRRTWPMTAVALLLVAGMAAAAPAQAGKDRSGTLTTASAPSAALGEPIAYTVYLPHGYAETRNQAVRYPVLYLLHGRGDTMDAWTKIKGDLDRMIADGTVPPVIAVLPDAPWNDRGNYYVDSAYKDGRAVETAFTRDLVAHVDGSYRTAAHRGARLIGGYSMGGAGALRFALAHQDLFANALVLSPAVYRPLPPAGSSAREFGAYGDGDALFSDAVYERLNYPALVPHLDTDLPVHMYIAVGDDEWANPDPADAVHDLDYEAATLYNTVRRSPAVSAEFRVVDGGHDWGVWQPSFVDGLTHLSATLRATPPAGLPEPRYGTPGADSAGGVAAHPDGTVSLAYAAAGPVEGQPNAGGLDAVVTRLDAGRPLWTRTFGTPANDRLYGAVPVGAGDVIAAGYTRGDLDGAHPGSPADDGVVARLTATGSRAWVTQVGAPTAADRFYAVAAAPDGGAYVAGYSSGSYAGPSAGDKDAVLARISAAGAVVWARQFGGTGEDKAMAVAVDGSDVYVAGVTSAGLPGTTYRGGSDGWLAHYTADGQQTWVTSDGSAGDDLFAGLAVADGTAVVTGALGEGTAGARDVLTAGYTAAGRQRWRLVTGGRGDEAGADVVALPGGDVEVVGFTDSALGVPAGAYDVLTVRVDRRGRATTVAQFGSARADGADAFAEENLFATSAGDRVLVTGLTDGDVFLASVDPATGTP